MRELLRGQHDDTSSESDDGTPAPVTAAHRSTDRAIKYMLDVVKKHGPFDAIIGYSEGATVASTMLLYQQRQQKRWGTKPLFKYGIFFAGWPPLDPKTHDIVLSDESDERIETRTLHIGELFSFTCTSTSIFEADPNSIPQLAHWIHILTALWPCTTFAIWIRQSCLTMRKVTHYRVTARLSESWSM